MRNSQSESEDFTHELQQEIQDRLAKEDHLFVQYARLHQQLQELMGKVVELDLIPN